MKKNLISIVILALLVVDIVLTAVMMFSVMSTNKKTAALVGKVATAIDLDLGEDINGEKEVKVVSIADTETYTIADMTIALKRGEEEKEDHYAAISVTLSMDSKSKDYKKYGDLSTREDLIKGEIYEVVGQHTMDEIKADQQMIKDEILDRVQTLFDSDFIFDVTLSSINIM